MNAKTNTTATMAYSTTERARAADPPSSWSVSVPIGRRSPSHHEPLRRASATFPLKHPGCRGDVPLMAPALIIAVLVVSVIGAVVVLRWGDQKIAKERAAAEAQRKAEARRRAAEQAPFPTQLG